MDLASPLGPDPATSGRRGHIRIGVDTGGTFTDVVAVDTRSGEVRTTKTPSTPSDPADGFLTGIGKILALTGASSADIESISHGTTVATNAVIEAKGAKIGLLTTVGFKDVLEIGRVRTPDSASGGTGASPVGRSTPRCTMTSDAYRLAG